MTDNPQFDDTGAGSAPVCRVRLDVAYDGTGFAGFAENRDVRTVAGCLREAMVRIAGPVGELGVAGRTDRGVHARGQVVHVDIGEASDPLRLRRSLNALLGPEIVVNAVTVVPGSFHARFSATGRRYRYRVLYRDVPDPFEANRSWHIHERLDWTAMNTAAAQLVGEHDFSTFCRRPKTLPGEPEASLVRSVISAMWRHERGDVWAFEISANAFCHHMVRSIVGTLVDVGRRRIDAESMTEIVDSKDRARCSHLAPPHGLYLEEVTYG